MRPYNWKAPESFAYNHWRKMVQFAHDADPEVNRPIFCELAKIWQSEYEMYEAEAAVRYRKEKSNG